MSKGNGKQAVWLYAVILFTSAFVVLLLTAYSQIKFNKNIDQYKFQLSAEEKEKLNFQSNLNSALEENKKHNKEISGLKEELNKVKSQVEQKNKDLAEADKRLRQGVSSYEVLAAAQTEYDRGNIVACAVLLKTQCNASELKEKGMEQYEGLVGKTYSKASELLFKEGYKEYIKKNNLSAIDSFKMALEFSKDKYFSDDCYYFIGYSYYNEGNNEQAKVVLKEMLEKYTNSNYSEDAQHLLKQIGG